jgi:AraC-like DNA-binding protein
MKDYSLQTLPEYRGLPLLVLNIPQGRRTLPHRHDFYEIVLVRHGRSIHGRYDPNGVKSSYGVIRGDVFSIMPTEIHSYEENDHFSIYNIIFTDELLEPRRNSLATLPAWDLLFSLPQVVRKRLHLMPGKMASLEHLFHKIQQELELCRTQADYHFLNAEILFYSCLIELAGVPNELWSRMPSNIDLRILRALQDMESEPLKEISVPKMARECGMCYSGFVRKFHEIVGMPPVEYSIALRLDQVRGRLENTRQPITEIAMETGFFDAAHLNKTFQKWYGMTPSQYRSRNRQISVCG